MFLNWPEHTAHVKKSFGELGKNHPKMLQAYGALEQAAAAEALDAKTRELIALAVAIPPVAKAASAYMPPQPPKRARLKAKSPARWRPLFP